MEFWVLFGKKNSPGIELQWGKDKGKKLAVG